MSMKDPFSQEILTDFFRTKNDGNLYHREKTNLEFKEQFNHASWVEYLKDFAAFANNSGGYMIFGIKNTPRKPVGLSDRASEMFESIDEESISGEINKHFSPYIEWQKIIVEYDDKKFALFYISESSNKPVIAKQNSGRNNEIKEGEIYFRYAGRTQKIQYAELNNIIQQRIDSISQHWLNLMNRIAKIGPSNAAILDVDHGLIEKNEKNVLMIDEKIIDKIKFIKEGSFIEKDGATALRLVGEVHPMSDMEIIKIEQKKLLDSYPLTYTELSDKIKINIPNIKRNKIDSVIKDSKLKENTIYSSFVFRNKQQEEEYKKNKIIPPGIPSIYNDAALEFILKILNNQE